VNSRIIPPSSPRPLGCLEVSFCKHIETAWPDFWWHHILLHRPKDGESSISPNDRGRRQRPRPNDRERACHDTLPWLISVSLGGFQTSLVPIQRPINFAYNPCLSLATITNEIVARCVPGSCVVMATRKPITALCPAAANTAFPDIGHSHSSAHVQTSLFQATRRVGGGANAPLTGSTVPTVSVPRPRTP
jgi:hypothetical protein